MSKAIYGIHDKNDWGYDGWEIRTEKLGHDPSHLGGTNYSLSRHVVIARLNNAYHPDGTIPEPQHYEAFAQRVKNFVTGSVGCHHWIIGNEMNHSLEWPHKNPIWPDQYGRCFTLCRDAIRSLPEHENDTVIVGAVAPYNISTKYPGNMGGDWIKYFEDVLAACRVYDGIAVHCYTRSQDPASVQSEAKMGAPYDHWHSGFRAYRDFLEAIPINKRHLPIYITETNPGANGQPWKDENTGWVQAAYAEVDAWNQSHSDRIIRCLALYRYDTADLWTFKHKGGVAEDFVRAVEKGYTWASALPQDPDPSPEPQPEVWEAEIKLTLRAPNGDTKEYVTPIIKVQL